MAELCECPTAGVRSMEPCTGVADKNNEDALTKQEKFLDEANPS